MNLNHSHISKRQLTYSLTTTEFLTKCDKINKLQMQLLTAQEHNDHLIYTPVPGTLNILKNANMRTLLLPFSITIFNINLTNCPDRYRLHMTK